FPQALLHARGEYRMRVRWIGADHQHHVGFLDRVEVLSTCRSAERLSESVAGGRMAYACAGVHIVVAEARAHQLLHQECLFVGASRRSQCADGADSVFRLDALELGCRMADGLFPANLTPRI